MLQLTFFNRAHVAFAGVPLASLNRSQICLRLLAFLLLHRERAYPRDYLTALFWPEMSAARANRTLNNVIWRLRQALGEAADRLSVEAETVQARLLAGDWLDVAAFAQQVAAITQAQQSGQWMDEVRGVEALIALYPNELLAGWDDAWLLPLRQSHHDAYITVLQGFTASCLQQKDQARLQRVQHCLSAVSATIAHRAAPDKASVAERIGANKAYLRRELEILCKRDELLDLMAERQQQQENLLLAQAVATQLGEPSAQLDILARLAWVATQRGDYATSLTLGQEGLQIATAANYPLERAAFHRQIGIASEELGDFHAALHHHTKALSYDEANQNLHYLPADLNNVATVHLTQGDYCQGIALLKQAQALCSAASHPTVYCKVLGNLGYGWMKLGELPAAQALLTEAGRCAADAGDQSAEWWIAIVQSKVAFLCGHSEDALRQLLQCYDQMNAEPSAGLLAYLTDTLAWLTCAQKNGEAAHAWAQRSCDYAADHSQWRYRLRALLRLAQAQCQLARYPNAFTTIATASVLYETHEQRLEEEAELFWTYAHCATIAGHRDKAAQSQARAENALGRQLAAITDLARQKSFLQMHSRQGVLIPLPPIELI